MPQRTKGLAVSLGGLAWLAGVAILELTFDSSSEDDQPVSFLLLALFAGTAVGWGCWSASPTLERRLSRVGLRSVAVCSFVLGLGFGLALVPDMFLAFLLSYSVGLFLLPVGFLVFGLGIAKSTVYPGWAKWLPFVVFAVALITYGFHAPSEQCLGPERRCLVHGARSRMGSPRRRYRLLPNSEPRVSQGSDSATTYAR